MKRQADRRRKEVEEWKKRQDDIEYKRFNIQEMASEEIGGLIYIIEKVVSTNAVKLQLPTLIRIHSVVNIS